MDTRKPNIAGKKYKKYKDKHNESVIEEFNFYDRVLKENLIVEKRKHFIVIKNMFPYEIWDGFEVDDHLLVIPKKFTTTISSFDNKYSNEYFQILADYEKKGYSFYARANQNVRKTVAHQHTHLITLNYNKPVKRLFNIAGKILWWL